MLRPRFPSPLVFLACLAPDPAWALQPLSAFVEAAHRNNFDGREARLTTRQREADVGISRAALLPSLSARGTYTQNQYEVKFALPSADGTSGEPITLTPKHQLDAFFTLTVPVVDPGAYGRYRASRFLAEATRLSEQATALGIEVQLAQAYHRLVGSSALVAAASRSVDAAQANASVVGERRNVGAASELDVERAKAEVARAEQDHAEAVLTRRLAARSLETLSGLVPDERAEEMPEDLSAERPLAEWLDRGASTPASRAAAKADEAASAARTATKLALLPSLNLAAEERLTNATAFVGRNSYYTLFANITWSLDAATVPRLDQQRATAEAARVASARARRNVEDQIYEAWNRIDAAIAKSKSARTQAGAAERSAELARERYVVGAATQTEVIQAQRDAFAAAVAQVQADAELSLARTQLRIAAGLPLAHRDAR